MSIISSEQAAQIRGELCEKHGATWLHYYHEAIEAAILEHQASASASASMNRRISEHQRERRELWMNVVVAVASSSNSTNRSSMTGWADHALIEFDRKFVNL